jgi:hypothetical protein
MASLVSVPWEGGGVFFLLLLFWSSPPENRFSLHPPLPFIIGSSSPSSLLLPFSQSVDGEGETSMLFRFREEGVLIAVVVL